MKALLTRLLLPTAVAAALGSGPAVAAAAEGAVVPPSNSAATQYTEAFPTSGGNKKTDQAARHRSPSKVLGGRKAHKLEQQGPDGRAAAAVAAATAPSPVAPSTTATAPDAQNASRDGGSGSGPNSGGSPGQTQKSAPQRSVPPAAASDAGSRHIAQPAGSSGLGSAIGQATGLSASGQTGILLPLILLATILWSFGYLWQQRRPVG
jgi:hypothetical protein